MEAVAATQDSRRADLAGASSKYIKPWRSIWSIPFEKYEAYQSDRQRQQAEANEGGQA